MYFCYYQGVGAVVKRTRGSLFKLRMMVGILLLISFALLACIHLHYIYQFFDKIKGSKLKNNRYFA